MNRSAAFRLGLVCLLPACAAAPPPEPHTVARTIEAGGRTRTYRLHIPPALVRPAPVLLAFHGGGGNSRFMEREGGFDALSDREGFLVAYPDGVEGNWNDGREVPGSKAHRERVDDVGFVRALIDQVSRAHPVDPRRVFATGISNGGFFSHYLAANLSDRIAAIAAVAGGIADPFPGTFHPAHPVSVLIVHGVEDPLVPYAGGEVRVLGSRRGRGLPAEEAARQWAAADGCRATPSEERLPDRDPSDGCRVVRRAWTGGRGGTAVVLLRIEGGGHTWPSGIQYLPPSLVGRVCRDVGAADLWEFLKAHPKAAGNESPPSP